MARIDLTSPIGKFAYNATRALLGPDGDFEMLATDMSGEDSLLLLTADDVVGWTADQTGPDSVEVRVIHRPEITRQLVFGVNNQGRAFNHFKLGDHWKR